MINQKRDVDMITRKIKVEIPTFHYDDLEVSEITTETSWMKLHISVLFAKDDVQITKELYKDYETGLWYYIKSDGMIISHKDTFSHSIKNLVDEMIYDCHLEMEVAKENEETDKTEYCESTNNDMLDEKRRHYMEVYRMTANVINSIYKCNRLTSIDKLRTNLIQTVRTMAKNEKIEWALVQYVKAKIDNCYLVNGLQSSFYSTTYGYNKSRSYTKTFFI